MLLAADMVDEMRITYIPVILGQGIPLFPDQSRESKWKLIDSKGYGKNDVLTLRYESYK